MDPSPRTARVLKVTQSQGLTWIRVAGPHMDPSRRASHGSESQGLTWIRVAGPHMDPSPRTAAEYSVPEHASLDPSWYAIFVGSKPTDCSRPAPLGLTCLGHGNRQPRTRTTYSHSCLRKQLYIQAAFASFPRVAFPTCVRLSRWREDESERGGRGRGGG